MRSGHDVPVNLHQINVILCSDKEGQGPKAQLSPSKVQVLAKMRGPLHGLANLLGSVRPASSLGPPISAQAG